MGHIPSPLPLRMGATRAEMDADLRRHRRRLLIVNLMTATVFVISLVACGLFIAWLSVI